MQQHTRTKFSLLQLCEYSYRNLDVLKNIQRKVLQGYLRLLIFPIIVNIEWTFAEITTEYPIISMKTINQKYFVRLTNFQHVVKHATFFACFNRLYWICVRVIILWSVE